MSIGGRKVEFHLQGWEIILKIIFIYVVFTAAFEVKPHEPRPHFAAILNKRASTDLSSLLCWEKLCLPLVVDAATYRPLPAKSSLKTVNMIISFN